MYNTHKRNSLHKKNILKKTALCNVIIDLQLIISFSVNMNYRNKIDIFKLQTMLIIIVNITVTLNIQYEHKKALFKYKSAANSCTFVFQTLYEYFITQALAYSKSDGNF